MKLQKYNFLYIQFTVFLLIKEREWGTLLFIDRGWGTEDEGQWEMGDERCMMCEGGMTMTKDHD